MRILFRYILREVVVSSLIGTLLFTFVLFLRAVGPLIELLIRPSGSSSDVVQLFLLAVVQTLRFTIPIGVLIGVLVGLGRMSSDGEIIALRAAGVPGSRCVPPIAVLATLGVLLCAATTLYFNPIALQETRRIGETLKISQATAEIQPRVFIESFPNRVLYVQDVIPGPIVRWKGIFIADERAPEDRGSFGGVNAAVNGPRITVAEEAIVVPRPEQDRLQLHLPHGLTFEQSYDAAQFQTSEFYDSDQVLETTPTVLKQSSQPFAHMPTQDLIVRANAGEDQLDASIELHQRLALPFACFVLPMVGIPLAISSKSSGKSVGIVFSLVLVFVYYMIQLGGIALAKEQLLAVIPAMWLANVSFGAVGAILLLQLDAPNRRDIAATILNQLSWVPGLLRRDEESSSPETQPPAVQTNGAVRPPGTGKLPVFTRASAGSAPAFRVVDQYVLRSFLLYLAVLVASFVMIWFVFSFFELLNDMLAREKMGLFVAYMYYLTPFLIYETMPLSVLVGTLVCFGILAKHNELTAFKACGISLYRLAAPILVTALMISGSLFALDYYYLPETNRRQDAIRDEIKGRPVRTFVNPDRRWTFGKKDRIFYHSFFDSEEQVLATANVFDFESEQFRLKRQISAERARWDQQHCTWVFENGWVREFDGNRPTSFETFEARAFPDLDEEPSYFLKEERQHQQMNWRELRAYISDLTQSGFDTVRLRVQLHKKLAFPLFAISMAVLAIPFSLVAGHRGALTGVALSIGLAITYYAINALFEQLGRASQLTPVIAAWAPSAIFGLAGMYLFLRVRS